MKNQYASKIIACKGIGEERWKNKRPTPKLSGSVIRQPEKQVIRPITPTARANVLSGASTDLSGRVGHLPPSTAP